MLRRTIALATLPAFFLLFTAACSDTLGPTAGQPSLRRGADNLPGDNRGVDRAGDDHGVDPKPHFRRGADDPAGDDRGVDAKPRGGKGADDPANHG